MLEELNKIAMVHLIAIGLEEECGNFMLTMNNPSIQSEVLRMELLQQKIDAYKAATEISSDGIAPMSHSRAKKLILNMSTDEIKHDLLEQRFERALGAELIKTEQIINRTKFFDEVDKLYGVAGAQYSANSDGTPSQFEGGGSGISAGSGGMDLGGEGGGLGGAEGGLGAEGGGLGAETGGAEGGLGAETGGGEGAEETPPTA